ncbi:hypothetical protein GQ43DRAFT_442173 [Delitschia confertaspora ATCC 74209]|uniref:Uncharacterized protein n=1 Tax=Delitschia confertaspora ATCC 74209 TaxID=1513339 RepID=A0A9P4MRB4_9PLEO|nr:hypothetical protein GQ43DRAFT_442173 [Delitschia confertaspora ATCC 74209]
MLGFTASRAQIATYLFGVALFSISFLVFLNSSISFVITQRIRQSHHVGDAVGTLGFADELVALVACPAWGVVSDRIGVRSVAVMGYVVVGVSLWVFVQAGNVYPQLLLARMLFSLGATATATMVTAILPTMTFVKPVIGPRSPTRGINGPSHTMAPSISSELTITPARFQSRSPTIVPREARKDNSIATSHLSGLVGMFTGCGALVALLIFLPLPTQFQKAGTSAAAAIADAYYVVGAIALLVAIACFFGLRNLPGEEAKGPRRFFNRKSEKGSEDSDSTPRLHSYPRLLWSSIQLGFRSQNIGLGYLGGFVARASSVAISLYIPLFTNTYFLRTGLCSTNPDDPSDIKHACPRAYALAAALTGVSQLVALMGAPLFGYLAGRYRRFNIPLMAAALVGVVGYTAFGLLPSPDPKSDDGTGAIFLIVALLGVSQIGAIVCSLGLLAWAITESEDEDEEERRGLDWTFPPPSGERTPRTSLPGTPVDEEEPLLRHTVISRPESSLDSKSLAHLRGSIAGTYSLAGGAGILILTKAGGALFDSSGPGSPFYMMAAFNGLLFITTLGIAVREMVSGWGREEHNLLE